MLGEGLGGGVLRLLGRLWSGLGSPLERAMPKWRDVEVAWTGPPDDPGDYVVFARVTEGHPGYVTGPVEKCYPPEPPEVEIVSVWDAEGKAREDLIPSAHADDRLYDDLASEAAEREEEAREP